MRYVEVDAVGAAALTRGGGAVRAFNMLRFLLYSPIALLLTQHDEAAIGRFTLRSASKLSSKFSRSIPSYVYAYLLRL